MRDQGLGRRQLQVELITQELADLSLDLFGFPPGTGEAQQPVIGIAAIAQPPVARIVRVAGGHGLHLLTQRVTGLPVSPLFQVPGAAPQSHVGPIRGASCSPVMGRQQGLFDECVQPVQVDIAEDG
jgi:hypothetical protein